MQADAMQALSYAYLAFPYVVALLLGLLVPALGVLCYSSFGSGVAVIVGMFAVEALYMFVGGFSVGVSLFYTDLTLAFVFVVAVLRLLTVKSRPRVHPAWFVYSAAAFLSLATGLAVHGSSAGVQARPYFYFVASALYGMSFEIDERRIRLLLDALAAVAVLLLCVTVYRWVVYYTPITELLPEEGAYNNDGPIRVIRSYETLVLAQALVASLFFAGAAGGLAVLRVLSPLLLMAVVALQHRSVWVAALTGVLAGALLSRLQRGSVIGQVLLVAGIGLTACLPMLLSDKLSGVGDQINSSAENALAGRGTASGRVNSWKGLVDNWAAAGPRSILIGQSFGTDPTRFVRDASGVVHKITETAHNMYVQTLFSMGLIGLGAFLFAAAYVVHGLYRICAFGQGGAPAQALLVLVLMQLVYFVPYGTDYLQSLIFGVALSYVVGRRSTSEVIERPSRTAKGTPRWSQT